MASLLNANFAGSGEECFSALFVPIQREVVSRLADREDLSRKGL